MAGTASKKSSTPVVASVTLTQTKVCKGVTRFDANDQDAALGNVYVSKAALAEMGNPTEIVVTIEAA